jgi:plastocyanin
MRKLLLALPVAAAVIVLGALGAAGAIGFGGNGSRGARVHQVTVPDSDQFTPFALTIRAGDKVRWVNNDSDDHTVVSDDAYNTPGKTGIDRLLAANGGTVTLRFRRPGTFVYYCRFHAVLNDNNQPVAPGPDGGIEDANGNFGTPMSGVITVLPGKRD